MKFSLLSVAYRSVFVEKKKKQDEMQREYLCKLKLFKEIKEKIEKSFQIIHLLRLFLTRFLRVISCVLHFSRCSFYSGCSLCSYHILMNPIEIWTYSRINSGFVSLRAGRGSIADDSYQLEPDWESF